MLKKILSGGQTGVDRAALDVALEIGLPCGGWCPKGRRAEDGRLAERYPLVETSSHSNQERTRLNVRDSDGTLILCRGQARGGTALTIRWAKHFKKPYLKVDLSAAPAAGILEWIEENEIADLNIAGPRESQSPGIYAITVGILRSVLAGSGQTTNMTR